MELINVTVAVVTCTSQGIGTGIAKGLAEAGSAVVVNHAFSKDGGDRVVAEIERNRRRAVAARAMSRGPLLDSLKTSHQSLCFSLPRPQGGSQEGFSMRPAEHANKSRSVGPSSASTTCPADRRQGGWQMRNSAKTCPIFQSR